jgi:hypothetical protein
MKLAADGSSGSGTAGGVLQVRGLLPGTLTSCPARPPRPRDRPQYLEACTAAEGKAVTEYDAAKVCPGMLAWFEGRFLPVHDVGAEVGDPRVQIFFAVPGGFLRWSPECDTPVYCLAGQSPASMHGH